MEAETPADEFLAYVGDQLRRWAPVTARRLFGGHGLYRSTVIFALILGDDTLYFRTDDENRRDFEAAGMAPFRYQRAGRTVALSYHQVPAEVLDDTELLASWAAKAYAAALRHQAKPRPARRRTAEAGMARLRPTD